MGTLLSSDKEDRSFMDLSSHNKGKVMLGIKRVAVHHFHWWISSWLCLLDGIFQIVDSLIGILSLGHLTIDWTIQWLWDLRVQRLEKEMRKEQ